ADAEDATALLRVETDVAYSGGAEGRRQHPSPRPRARGQAARAAAGQAQEGGPAAVITVEATGETVSEAKWKALRELERLEPAVGSAPDLGLLIGRHGQTIDAVQTLAYAILRQDENARKQVVVDAAGYRDRRRRTIEALAVHSAEEALRSGARVALEPMSSGDRRLVHERLKAYAGVETSSEGDEPNRYVVVFPGS